MRRVFLAKIANFNVFSAQKHKLKKCRGGQEKNLGGKNKNRGGKNENRKGIAPAGDAPGKATELCNYCCFTIF